MPNSKAVLDACNVCGGDGTSCIDCAGVLRGTSVTDKCGVCGGKNACLDCAGTPNGNAKELACGCDDATSCIGCDGRPRSGKAYDKCNVCGGTNACLDCAGVPFGSATILVCGCNDKSSCLGCDGVAFSGAIKDRSDVCGGSDWCDKKPNSGKTDDKCGVCGGFNACVDCAGVPFGTSHVDACGVCGGGGAVDACGVCNGNNICVDCSGKAYGTKKFDFCGVCGGDGTTCPLYTLPPIAYIAKPAAWPVGAGENPPTWPPDTPGGAPAGEYPTEYFPPATPAGATWPPISAINPASLPHSWERVRASLTLAVPLPARRRSTADVNVMKLTIQQEVAASLGASRLQFPASDMVLSSRGQQTLVTMDIIHSGDDLKLSPRELFASLLAQSTDPSSSLLAPSRQLTSKTVAGSVEKLCETGCDNGIACKYSFVNPADFDRFIEFMPINDPRGVCGGAAWCDEIPNSGKRDCSANLPPASLSPLSARETRAPMAVNRRGNDEHVRAQYILSAVYPPNAADRDTLKGQLSAALAYATMASRSQFPVDQMVLVSVDGGASSLLQFDIRHSGDNSFVNPRGLYDALSQQTADPASRLALSAVMPGSTFVSIDMLCEWGCENIGVCKSQFAQVPEPAEAFTRTRLGMKINDPKGVCGGAGWCDGVPNSGARDCLPASPTFVPINEANGETRYPTGVPTRVPTVFPGPTPAPEDVPVTLSPLVSPVTPAPDPSAAVPTPAPINEETRTPAPAAAPTAAGHTVHAPIVTMLLVAASAALLR
jgi:hypothetical protein